MFVLFVTGVAWLALDRLKEVSAAAAWPEAGASLLMLHGGAAMLMLLLLGALMPHHIRVAWRRRHNRTTGMIILGANAVLIATAFGLYYWGAETLRRWTSDLHIGVGLGLPVLLVLHVLRGKRSRSQTARNP